MRSFTLLILTLLSINVPVLASSRLWQPPVVDKPGLNRRWVTILLGEDGMADSRSPTVQWPERKIPYCINANTGSRDRRRLKKAIKDAHNLWLSAGLSEEFQVTEGSSSYCQDHDNRKDYLLVTLGNGLETTPGFPRQGMWNSREGAESDLSFRTDVGMLNPVLNIAHELGHAWGLGHEHQNPYFWSSDIEEGQGGEVFGPANNGNWKCENLMDYDRFAEGKTIAIPDTFVTHYSREELCSSWALASRAGFSAAQYLPRSPTDFNFGVTSAADSRSVDWDSIMLYPSGSGAKRGDEALDEDGDRRLSILERPPDPSGGELRRRNTGSRSRITKSKIPSAGDVDGLKGLYGAIKVSDPGILQKKKSLANLFNKSFLSSRRGESSSCL